MESHHFASFRRGGFPIECDEELRLARTAGAPNDAAEGSAVLSACVNGIVGEVDVAFPR
jgi:hypothetical protein